ncbi:maltose permease [Microdochium trichocladiopsis]|uniref:Maltose permease n=1 Tax=Microdochium trichocladiopsis TaxID=1682393 RepID=A0A9P9C0Z1_9PEZI|nr:maltose permease [Microdochium trichocladiopsis]KAH7041609.1 maltose permease [Microdochium trichocladiopsis]
MTAATADDKTSGEPMAAEVTHHHCVDKDTPVENAIGQEHELTLGQVFRHHKAVAWWCFYWAMCAVGWGFDAQINGAMIAVAAFRRDFGYVLDGEAILPADWQTAFNMISTVGQFFGGFLCSWLADRIGRKNSLGLGILLCTGGAIGEILSHTRPAFLGSKLVLGVGLGFYLTLAPLACSEIAPVALRGYATAGINLGIAIGQLLSNAVVKAFGERDDRWAYAGPFATQLFFVAFLVAFLPFAPETPWYLARKGKREQALKEIRKLFGSEYDAEKRLLALMATIDEEASSQSKELGFIDCFRGTNRLRTGISTGVFLCQHLVGIVFVLGYSTYFFQLAGFQRSKSFDLGVGVTACGVFGNIVSWFVVERYGRRLVFISGMGTLTFILLLIGIMDVVPTSAASWVQASVTVIYAFVYFLTIGAMAFAVLGETSSTVLRAKTISLATATQAICGLVMNAAIPYMVNPDQANLRGKVGFIFGGLAFIATVGSWIYVPELKGKTFGEIDRLFAAKVPPRKMGNYGGREETSH